MQNGFILNCSLGLHLPFSYLKSDYFHNSQSYERICTHFFDQSRFFQPIKTSKYINLFFFGSPFTFLETQILQGLSHCIFFCKQKNIVIQLKRIKHPKINAYCYCRCPFLDTWNRKRRTGSTFGNLSDTKVSMQSCKSDLFSHNLHLLLQFSWQFGTHCTFCHNSIYHIIYKFIGFTLFYDMLQK